MEMIQSKNISRSCFVILLVGIAFALSSCIRADQLALQGVESFQLEGVTPTQVGVKANIKALNASAHKLTITQMQLDVRAKNDPILTLQLRDKVVLPRRTSGTVTVPLVIRFQGPLGALNAYSQFKKGIRDITISGSVTAKVGWGKKHIDIPETSLEALARQFGINPNDLFKNL